MPKALTLFVSRIEDERVHISACLRRVSLLDIEIVM